MAIVTLILLTAGCLEESSDERVYTEADISTHKAKVGKTVWFNGTAPDRKGTIECSWSSSLDGVLSTQKSFSSNSLSRGEHTIYFECQDVENTWLERAITYLEITTGNIAINLDSSKDSNDDYRVSVISTSMNIELESFHYFLRDSNDLTQQFGEIALQNLSGDWHGIDVTWDDDGSADTNQGNNKADRSAGAGGAYSDPDQAQIRIDDIQAGTQGSKDHQKSEGTISVSYQDNDRDGKLTAGDSFLILGNDATHKANDDYTLDLKYDLNDNVVGSVGLG